MVRWIRRPRCWSSIIQQCRIRASWLGQSGRLPRFSMTALLGHQHTRYVFKNTICAWLIADSVTFHFPSPTKSAGDADTSRAGCRPWLSIRHPQNLCRLRRKADCHGCFRCTGGCDLSCKLNMQPESERTSGPSSKTGMGHNLRRVLWEHRFCGGRRRFKESVEKEG